jgi:hypothetical protein
MKIKKNSESVGVADFLYDLFHGGYFNPESYLKDQKDIDDVCKAIETIKEYKIALIKAKKIEDI